MILYTKHLVINIFDTIYLQSCFVVGVLKIDSYAFDLR